MKDPDPVNARRLVSDKIPDMYSRGQLLKLSGLVRIAFGLDEDIYFIYICLEVVEDRFLGAYHPLSCHNILLKHFV